MLTCQLHPWYQRLVQGVSKGGAIHVTQQPNLHGQWHQIRERVDCPTGQTYKPVQSLDFYSPAPRVG